MQSNNANFKMGVTDIFFICLMESTWDHDMEKNWLHCCNFVVFFSLHFSHLKM